MCQMSSLMPFKTTTTPPSINATVTVRFSGLLLLKPGPKGNTCEVGVHRTSTSPHAFQVMLIVNKPKQPLTFIRLLTGPLTGDLNIEAQPATNGFQVFTPTPEPFVRNDDGNNEFDFRWAVNMSPLHPGADFNGGARPVARLNEGILYTGNLSPEAFRPMLGQQGTRGTPQFRIAADLAAAIDLAPGSTVMISWDQSGNARNLELPRPLDREGTTYTIVLLNEPPGIGGEGHDEFAEYYGVLEVGGAKIKPAERFLLDFGQPGSDEIPCMPVVLNPR